MRLPALSKFAAVLILPLLLAACLFVPGKFTSNMTVDKNGAFSFAYKGEIIALSSNKALGDMGSEEEKFEASCYTDEGENRDCTAAEITEQRKEWDAGAADRAQSKAEKQKTDSEMATAMMGFDPKDPKAIQAFTDKLMKQKGWRSVVHKGDGVFEVDYAITGTLDRDFVFPLLPDVTFPYPMVVARVRNDNSVMIEAPGFGDKSEQGSKAMTAMASSDASEKGPIPDGVFTVTTNGTILTNNTDDGPKAASDKKGWRQMRWPVTPQSKKVPETLVQLTP